MIAACLIAEQFCTETVNLTHDRETGTRTILGASVVTSVGKSTALVSVRSKPTISPSKGDLRGVQQSNPIQQPQGISLSADTAEHVRRWSGTI